MNCRVKMTHDVRGIASGRTVLREAWCVVPLRPGSPAEVLQALVLGADVVDTRYPIDLAVAGRALVESDLDAKVDNAGDETGGLFPEGDGETGDASWPQPLTESFRDEKYEKDFSVFRDGYSRAYVHHLLKRQEMLGTILLVRHNLSVFDCFMARCRDRIKDATLRRWARKLVEQWRANPPEPKANDGCDLLILYVGLHNSSMCDSRR